jgi:hypothetical protein
VIAVIVVIVLVVNYYKKTPPAPSPPPVAKPPPVNTNTNTNPTKTVPTLSIDATKNRVYISGGTPPYKLFMTQDTTKNPTEQTLTCETEAANCTKNQFLLSSLAKGQTYYFKVSDNTGGETGYETYNSPAAEPESSGLSTMGILFIILLVFVIIAGLFFLYKSKQVKTTITARIDEYLDIPWRDHLIDIAALKEKDRPAFEALGYKVGVKDLDRFIDQLKRVDEWVSKYPITARAQIVLIRGYLKPLKILGQQVAKSGVLALIQKAEEQLKQSNITREQAIQILVYGREKRESKSERKMQNIQQQLKSLETEEKEGLIGNDDKKVIQTCLKNFKVKRVDYLKKQFDFKDQDFDSDGSYYKSVKDKLLEKLDQNLKKDVVEATADNILYSFKIENLNKINKKVKVKAVNIIIDSIRKLEHIYEIDKIIKDLDNMNNHLKSIYSFLTADKPSKEPDIMCLQISEKVKKILLNKNLQNKLQKIGESRKKLQEEAKTQQRKELPLTEKVRVEQLKGLFDTGQYEYVREALDSYFENNENNENNLQGVRNICKTGEKVGIQVNNTLIQNLADKIYQCNWVPKDYVSVDTQNRKIYWLKARPWLVEAIVSYVIRGKGSNMVKSQSSPQEQFAYSCVLAVKTLVLKKLDGYTYDRKKFTEKIGEGLKTLGQPQTATQNVSRKDSEEDEEEEE